MSGVLIWMSTLAVAVALSIGVATVATAAIEQSQASSAADAAALAAAADGPQAAARVSELNGANLVSVTRNGDIFGVIVQVGDSTAEAFAERLSLPF